MKDIICRNSAHTTFIVYAALKTGYFMNSTYVKAFFEISWGWNSFGQTVAWVMVNSCCGFTL